MTVDELIVALERWRDQGSGLGRFTVSAQIGQDRAPITDISVYLGAGMILETATS